MCSKFATIAIFAALFAPASVQATLVHGNFSGTMSDGTDTTGVFGTPGADLANDVITGTFAYNTSLLSQSISNGTNTATGTGIGALTVTITITGHSHTFTDPTSSSMFLDDGGVSGQSEFKLHNSNNNGTTTNESVSLDISDLFTPFATSTDLTQSISVTNPFSSIDSFGIHDTGPNVAAAGDFSIISLTTTTQSQIPEPASLTVLALGLAGIATARRRRAA